MNDKQIKNLKALYERLNASDYVTFLSNVSSNSRADEPHNRWDSYFWNVIGFAAWLTIDQLGYYTEPFRRVTYNKDVVRYPNIVEIFGESFASGMDRDVNPYMSTLQYVDHLNQFIKTILDKHEETPMSIQTRQLPKLIPYKTFKEEIKAVEVKHNELANLINFFNEKLNASIQYGKSLRSININQDAITSKDKDVQCYVFKQMYTMLQADGYNATLKIDSDISLTIHFTDHYPQ
jgi:hypothetical protein